MFELSTVEWRCGRHVGTRIRSSSITGNEDISSLSEERKRESTTCRGKNFQKIPYKNMQNKTRIKKKRKRKNSPRIVQYSNSKNLILMNGIEILLFILNNNNNYNEDVLLIELILFLRTNFEQITERAVKNKKVNGIFLKFSKD